MSVKLRITLWFTVMIMLLMVLVISIVYVVSDESLTDEPEDELIETVTRNIAMYNKENHKNKGDKKKIDDHMIYHDGVYCQYFDENCNYIAGAIPEDIKYDKALENGNFVTYSGESKEYYIYDMKYEGKDETIWVRGFISTDEPSEITKNIILLVSILLPIILVVSVGGGWFIASHSLKGVDKIIDAVESINDGTDLSARVNIKKGPKEIKRLSNNFDDMFERLEKSFIAERQFASDVSHELRTPITVILGQCHELKNSELTKEEYCSGISVIEKQSEHMSGLIEQLLNITRLQQKTDRFKVQLQPLSDFVSGCVEEFCEEKGVNVNTEIDENIDAYFNPSLMARVLYNLLDNAVKYTENEKVISIKLHNEEKMSVIKVLDNGKGIAEEDLDKIWNRFWQADTSRSVDEGVGLGLAMVKEMVEFQGGYVEVSSQLGNGSIFSVYLKGK